MVNLLMIHNKQLNSPGQEMCWLARRTQYMKSYITTVLFFSRLIFFSLTAIDNPHDLTITCSHLVVSKNNRSMSHINMKHKIGPYAYM